jgi:hypothetical protein
MKVIVIATLLSRIESSHVIENIGSVLVEGYSLSLQLNFSNIA